MWKACLPLSDSTLHPRQHIFNLILVSWSDKCNWICSTFKYLLLLLYFFLFFYFFIRTVYCNTMSRIRFNLRCVEVEVKSAIPCASPACSWGLSNIKLPTLLACCLISLTKHWSRNLPNFQKRFPLFDDGRRLLRSVKHQKGYHYFYFTWCLCAFNPSQIILRFGCCSRAQSFDFPSGL